jgi:hypothetical protein
MTQKHEDIDLPKVAPAKVLGARSHTPRRMPTQRREVVL